MTIPLRDVEPIATCPKDPETPYVLLHHEGYPFVAEWDRTNFTVPCWSYLMRGSFYGLSIDEIDVVGWYPVRIPPRP